MKGLPYPLKKAALLWLIPLLLLASACQLLQAFEFLFYRSLENAVAHGDQERWTHRAWQINAQLDDPRLTLWLARRYREMAQADPARRRELAELSGQLAETVLRRIPVNPPAYLELYQSRRLLDEAAAWPLLQVGVQLAPFDLRLREAEIRALLRLGWRPQALEALARFEPFLPLYDPASSSLLRQRYASLLLASGSPGAARIKAERALSDDSGNIEARFVLASVAALAGDWPAVYPQVQAALGSARGGGPAAWERFTRAWLSFSERILSESSLTPLGQVQALVLRSSPKPADTLAAIATWLSQLPDRGLARRFRISISHPAGNRESRLQRLLALTGDGQFEQRLTVRDGQPLEQLQARQLNALQYRDVWGFRFELPLTDPSPALFLEWVVHGPALQRERLVLLLDDVPRNIAAEKIPLPDGGARFIIRDLGRLGAEQRRLLASLNAAADPGRLTGLGWNIAAQAGDYTFGPALLGFEPPGER